MSWLKRKLFRKKISIAVIGIGNAGCKIGDEIIHQLRDSKLTVKSLAINYRDNFEPKIKNFSDNYWFGKKDQSSSNGILDIAWKDIQDKNLDIKNKLEDVVFFKEGDKKSEENQALHLVVGSGGGTGSAGTMLVSNMLLEITGEPPTVIYVVPEKDEPSLVQYNAATALHFLGFSAKGPQSPIILFDNDKLLKMLQDEDVEDVLNVSNDLLAETLTTTILAALQDSTHEEYHADLSDFFASFTQEARGLGVIVSLDKEFETLQKAQNVRFSDIFFNELDDNSSLTADVSRAKLGYLAITTPTTFQSTFETRKIEKKFEKGSIKIALTTIDEPILTIRGILTGIHPDFVDRFWEILEKGRDSRKEILEKEEKIKQSHIELSK